MSKPWKALTTEEEKHFFKAKFYKIPSPRTLDILYARPLTRIAYTWKINHRKHGLSPFALAGISKHSPEEVLKQLLEERTSVSITFCSDTRLPICNYQLYFDEITPSLRVDIPNYWDNDAADITDEELPIFDDLMTSYGGKTWRKHCNRSFDPFNRNCKIPPSTWKDLREVYEGRPLRLKKEKLEVKP